MHVWGILAHLGLVVAVAINYIYDLDKATRSTTWSHLTAAEANSRPRELALAAASNDGFTFDRSTHALLNACLVVVSPASASHKSHYIGTSTNQNGY